MASIAGKEAGVFFPSSTMANLVSVLTHCDRRGSEVMLGNQSHIFLYEQVPYYYAFLTLSILINL